MLCDLSCLFFLFFFNDTATTEIYTYSHSFPTRRSSDLWRSLLTTSSQCRAKARPWADISPAWKRNHDFWVSARTDQACRIIAHTQALQPFIIALQFSGCRQLRIKPLVFLPSKLTHIVPQIRLDRQSVVLGKSVSVRVDLGC